jgi:hypothetical protein
MRIVCDKCYTPISCLDPTSIEDEYGEVVCQDCRDNRDEAAYERQQQSLMDGDHLERQVKEDQQLRDAGRGHLVRP